MIKKVFIFILIILSINLVTYFFIGKNKMLFDFVENESENVKDSGNVFFISNKSDFYKKGLEFFFKEKEDMKLSFFYVKKDGFFMADDISTYTFEVVRTIPLFSYTDNGCYVKSNMHGFEYIYVWFFYKWIRVHKHKRYLL